MKLVRDSTILFFLQGKNILMAEFRCFVLKTAKSRYYAFEIISKLG